MKFCWIILSLCLTSCNLLEPPKPTRVAEPSLSQKTANARFRQIKNISYALDLNISEEEEYFGSVTITFDLAKKAATTLDFWKGVVVSMVINGESVSPVSYNDFFIDLPADKLNKGKNTVVVEYRHPYSKNGVGLYRYVDPEDDRVYLYSDFEPYDAHHLLPCFDQPDLKAKFSSKITAPKSWEVISTTMETEKTATGDNLMQWTFPQSALISSYIYSLHAGPYVKWESQVKTSNHVVPLRLFARKSMADFVDINEWFVPMQQGFVYYEKYFGAPYPYGKYDNVIVPDFNSGAMENAAAVTYNESRYITRGAKQKIEKRSLASVIMHELAHMWFGNLVTMKWWNDLWLNESFATYMAYKAMEQATKEFKDEKLVFYNKRKGWGYKADKSVATHPIEGPVASTSKAFANFDGISYGKGASVLKQLAYFVGEDQFQAGVANYFSKYAEKNTVLTDFMNEIASASGVDLNVWQQKWLQTAGVNTLKADYACEDGKVTSLKLVQEAPKSHPTLRPHKTQLAWLNNQGGSYVAAKTMTVEYDGAETLVPEAKGTRCPEVLWPNYGDFDYAQVVLSAPEVAVLENNLQAVKDPLTRTMLWTTLWELVQDQELSALKYLDIVEKQGMAEPVASTQILILENVLMVLKFYLPENGEWAKKRKSMVLRFEGLLRDRVQKTAGRPEQKMWFDNYIATVESRSGLDFIAGLLSSEKNKFVSFDIDQERRWQMLIALAAYDHPRAQKLFAAEKTKDSSQRGELAALQIQALEPKLTVKKTFFERAAQGPKAESLYNINAILLGLFPPNQREIHRTFADNFFSKIEQYGKSADLVFVRNFTKNLVPMFCDEDSSGQIQKFVAAQKQLPLVVSKTLRIAAQEDERCQGIRKLLNERASQEGAPKPSAVPKEAGP